MGNSYTESSFLPARMETPVPLSTMFTSVGLSFSYSLPLFVLALLALLSIPATLRPNVRADAVFRALYHELAKTLGVLLLTAGGLPALYAVVAQQPLSALMYVGLLLVFASGGLLFLWHDARIGTLDPASRALPVALFFAAWKLVGLLIVVFTLLSLVLRLLFLEERSGDWWSIHAVMLLYGLLLSWFTLDRPVLSRPAAPVTLPSLPRTPPPPRPVQGKIVPPKARKK